jgi:hypothetical protein
VEQSKHHPKLSNKILFIINWINNLTYENKTSWENLLAALRVKVENNDDSIFRINHFPLLFETPFLFGKNNGSIQNEIELKRIVSKSVKHIISNEIHIIGLRMDFIEIDI